MPLSNQSFLSITDLHFNPCFDPGLIPKLAATDAGDWAGIFETASVTDLSDYGKDTNYPLLKSLFNDLASFADTDFVIFSGDFLGHNQRKQYQAGSNDKTDDGFSAFITKTVQFLADQFKAAFPGKVIFPCMGNDDNICGDYEITPFGEFLSMFTETWQPFMDFLDKDGGSSFADTFPMGGYYTASIPGRPNHRLVVLNNIFMSQKYRNACGSKPGDPAMAQLSWLEWVLYQSRTRNEKIWLVFHEPMGINMYPALHGKNPNCADNVNTFMKSRYGDILRSLLGHASDLIQGAFCGHTHMDEFRILHDAGTTPLMAMHVTPSVSPMFGNNPGYQVFFTELVTGAPADYLTRMVDLSVSTDPASAVWKEEYRFSDAFGWPSLTPHAMADLRKAIYEDETLRDRYIQHYAVGNTQHSLLTSENWKAFYDCMWDNTREAFINDYCPPHQSSLMGRKLVTGKEKLE